MRSEKWNPWGEIKECSPPKATNKYNSMKGPPCSDCVHWNPQIKYIGSPIGQVHNGIICCHAEKMFNDFSCFEDKSPTVD